MKTVTKIIEAFGGMEKLRDHPIKIQNEPYMPLCIEWIGDQGPRGWPMVAVFHHYTQNGDLMMDPEMTFEIARVGWFPLSYRQDGLGIYQEAVYRDDDKVMVAPRLVRDLESFAAQWDRNIAEQGFLARR